MAQDSFISKVGLTLGCLVAVALILVVAIGWFQHNQQTEGKSSILSTDRSKAGWEIRYNATIALARRGSDRVAECMDLLQEMLDEERQMQNFRTRSKDGKEIPNEAEAYQSLTNTLKAVMECHARRPEMDWSPLSPAIKRLAETNNPSLRAEAQKALSVLHLQ
ncbi:MAG TPA: hypothetical protein VGY77_02815 [Gemmataceae bacterium]|nr:hypothetical protein [Gemmataceae bacterium]